MRGGEKCLEVFCELFPEADIYTLLHIKGSVSPIIEKHSIKTSFIQHLPFSSRFYRYYLPLFPIAIERFELGHYDLIFSSSHCAAKGVRTSSETCHISYIYTPMRYIWDQHGSYFENPDAGWLSRIGMGICRSWLQTWDAASGKRPYALIAISHHVAERIGRCYGRKADVIHPPVDGYFFSESERDEGFYLMVTAFSPYKRIDLAVSAFNRLRWPLKIIGTGQGEKRLKRLAGPTIEFLGWREDDEIRQAYASCRAVVFPGEEDFGIVPLEAMASGKPLIAYARGGVLETVVPLQNPGPSSPTGVFFDQQTPESLMEALRYFERERHCFDPSKIREHVAPFDRRRFRDQIGQYVQIKYQEFQTTRHAEKTQ